jgi:predicted DNA-binding transcriptional regulator YafY
MKEPRSGASGMIMRMHALIEVLREGALTRSELIARVSAIYPSKADHARRMIERDIADLAALGIVIERERREKPVSYQLRGGLPVFTADELRTLALIRDSFDPRHPQFGRISALLQRLSAGLCPGERRQYEVRAARRAPIRPAIDYRPYSETIEILERVIALREPICFRYRSTRGREREHSYVEAYDIEFYERHFYLVAYSSLSRQINDFRIDRISQLATSQQRLPPGSARERRLIRFRYRLAPVLAQGELSQRFEQQRIVEHLADGSVIIEAEGRSDFFIIQTLLRYRANAELLEPDWLRERMAAEIRAMLNLYISDTPSPG